MDTTKINDMSTGQKVAGAAGISALISSFLPWYALRDEFVDNLSFSGREFTFGWMGLVLLLAAAGLVVAPAFGKSIGNDKIQGEQIAIGVAGLGAFLWLIRLAMVPAIFFGTVGRAYGLFIAAAAAAGVIAGTVMTMKEKGIEMPSLENFKSIKDGVSATSTDGPVMAVAPAPAPVQHQAPAPVQHQAPAPVQHQAPAPVQHQAPAPAPVQHQAPAPAPVQHQPPAPAPVQHQPVYPAPAPAPVQHPQQF